MNQFNISYQISLLHEALVMPLGRSTLLNAIFDLIAVGLNQSYLGADSLTVIVKLG